MWSGCLEAAGGQPALWGAVVESAVHVECAWEKGVVLSFCCTLLLHTLKNGWAGLMGAGNNAAGPHQPCSCDWTGHTTEHQKVLMETLCTLWRVCLVYVCACAQVEELVCGQLLMGCFDPTGLPLDATGVQLQVGGWGHGVVDDCCPHNLAVGLLSLQPRGCDTASLPLPHPITPTHTCCLAHMPTAAACGVFNVCWCGVCCCNVCCCQGVLDDHFHYDGPLGCWQEPQTGRWKVAGGWGAVWC